MLQETITTTPLGEFDYMPLPDGRADVFIYKFAEEIEDEEGNKSYKYQTNEFRTNRITRAMVETNPMRYINYSETEETLEEKVKILEECLIEMANIIYA